MFGLAILLAKINDKFMAFFVLCAIALITLGVAQAIWKLLAYLVVINE